MLDRYSLSLLLLLLLSRIHLAIPSIVLSIRRIPSDEVRTVGTMHTTTLLTPLVLGTTLSSAFSWQQPPGHPLFGAYFGRPGINATYDYVVVGGGTAGLTVATRLAENRSVSVAVVEGTARWRFIIRHSWLTLACFIQLGRFMRSRTGIIARYRTMLSRRKSLIRARRRISGLIGG